jgi:hypothetical protein
MNKYILAKEKTIENIVFREFKKSKNDFVILLEQQETKAFTDSLKVFLDKFIERAVKFIPSLKPIINKGASTTKIKDQNFNIDWNLRNEPAVRYLQSLKDLHLSQNKGSIWKNTKDEIIWLLTKWANDWLSYQDIAKEIRKTDPFVFSKSRAELIAVTEVWRAYEFGKFQPMKDLQNKGYIVLKKWETVRDDRVRKSHTQNQRDGYIPLDIAFSWTGDLYAPAKNKDPFRCRCSTIYSIK